MQQKNKEMTLNEYENACGTFVGIYILSLIPIGLINIAVTVYLISASSKYLTAFRQFLSHRFGDSGDLIGGAIGGLAIGGVFCIIVIPTMMLIKKLFGVKCPSCGKVIVDKACHEYAINSFRCLKCKSVIITKT